MRIRLTHLPCRFSFSIKTFIPSLASFVVHRRANVSRIPNKNKELISVDIATGRNKMDAFLSSKL